MMSKTKFYLGWVFLWLPVAIIYFTTKPVLWIHNKTADLCNLIDEKLMLMYGTNKVREITKIKNERNDR